MKMNQIWHFWAILQIDLTWPLTFICDFWPHEHVKVLHYINKPSLIPIRLQLFKWGEFYILSPSYNLNSDDLWPWYVTFDLINQWGFPCCIYDPTLVAIHQSMLKVEPNVNLFSQQTTKDERGTPDRRGFPDRTVQPRPDSGHGAIFCLNRGSVRSGVKKTGRVGNGVVFSRCGYFFSVRG